MSTATSSTASEINFSYEQLDSEDVITIPEKQQMIVHGAIDIDGTLIIEGTLVLI